MRIIAYILNVLLIVFAISAIIDEWGDFDFIFLCATILLACPVVNIIALSRPCKVGLLGLYLQRKVLEEKKKIEALNSSTESKSSIEDN